MTSCRRKCDEGKQVCALKKEGQDGEDEKIKVVVGWDADGMEVNFES